MSKKENHKIFSIQAGWTIQTRNHLYRKAGLLRAENILEVGCGTGVILKEIIERTEGSVVGVDKNPASLREVKCASKRLDLNNSDAHNLPFAKDTFDITLCNYLLLWVESPIDVIREMLRVTHNDGYVLIMAEPDYQGIIEFPNLGIKDRFLMEIQKSGVIDLSFGRKLNSILKDLKLYYDSGCINYTYGINDYSVLSMSGIKEDRLKRLTTYVQPIFYACIKK